jgi:hypothetical protein
MFPWAWELRRFVLTDITRRRPTIARPMVITGRNGSQAAYLLVPVPGITGLITSTATSITISIIARAIMVRFPPAAIVPRRVAPNFTARRCMTRVATKRPVAVDKGQETQVYLQYDLVTQS